MSTTTYTINPPDVALLVRFDVGGELVSGIYNTPGDHEVPDTYIDSTSFYQTEAAALAAAAAWQPNFNGAAVYGELDLTDSITDRPFYSVSEFEVNQPASIGVSFTSTDGTVTYQWYKRTKTTNIPSEGFTLMEGATGSSVSTTSFKSDHAGIYKCVVNIADTATYRSRSKEVLFQVTEIDPPVLLTSDNAIGM